MDILQQCQEWHEHDEYQKIIDTLEAIPADQRSPEMDNELARAYNNLADHTTPEGRDMLKKAIALLEPHEDYFEGDHLWNFRMGYSYFYLDQEGRALPYLQKALEALPGDEDTQHLIDACLKLITLPNFQACLRERTEAAWAAFVQQEAQLRQIIDTDGTYERAQELVDTLNEISHLAFDDISFELGFNGEKYDLILTPEGDKAKLFELIYFRKQAPQEIMEHWNIIIGRQAIKNIGIHLDDGLELSFEDVQLWVEKLEDKFVSLFVYCEKLLPMLEEEEGRAWWILSTLIDQTLGELAHMRYVDSLEVLSAPKPETSFTLEQLPDILHGQGFALPVSIEDYLDTYMMYEWDADEDPEADWRLDICAGKTRCTPPINGYMSGDNYLIDNLHADGAVAGFIAYPLESLQEKDSNDKIFAFQQQLEEAFSTPEAEELLTLTGEAIGLFCGYIDFIAWDLHASLQLAQEFFNSSDIPWAIFHTFRREAAMVFLKRSDEESTSQTPKFYSAEETETLEQHIHHYFGEYESVFHEIISPDIHVDIYPIQPSEGEDYLRLVTGGMGAYLMNVPEELTEYQLQRAELCILLPKDWKLQEEDLEDERWYWPIRLLKSLARLPIESDSWLGLGHTVDNREHFAENTELCACILIYPQVNEEAAAVCKLPNGDNVNFYQVIPLYKNELDYKLEHGVDALLSKITDLKSCIHINRPSFIGEND